MQITEAFQTAGIVFCEGRDKQMTSSQRVARVSCDIPTRPTRTPQYYNLHNTGLEQGRMATVALPWNGSQPFSWTPRLSSSGYTGF